MYIKRNYGFFMTLNWSKWPLIIGTLYAAILLCLEYFFEISIFIPWQPISVIGIAVAFYLGFKNNSSYDRTWEARKIWGSIVNDSRAFGAAVNSFVQGEKEDEIKKELIYRHLAWLTALRHQLRLSRPWEHSTNRLSIYAPTICEDYYKKLDRDLARFLSNEEIQDFKAYKNVAAQILKVQSERLQELKDKEYYEDFRHMEFHKLVTCFYEHEGDCERIKDFPFPRQYASTALWLTVVFCVLVPFGMLDILNYSKGWIHWLAPVLSGIVTWVFFLMEKIGDYSENPFEGTYNDVPITNISREIEIDLREMIQDNNIPEMMNANNGFLM